MTDEHPCASYADRAWQGTVVVEENVRIARDTYRVRLACPQIARLILPGQFVMMRLPGCNDPLLGRPLALYDVWSGSDGTPQSVDIVYLIVGRMTRLLSTCTAGQSLEVWGPLGNGFSPMGVEQLLMVAGGIGQTPFLSLAREYLGSHRYGDPPRQVRQARKVTLCYGARDKEYLAGVEDFARAGVDVRLATEDGSAGHHGLVTDLIRPVVEESPGPWHIVSCGPEPMMEATAAVARQLELPCQVSLETPMACGIGVCFSCVAKIRDAAGNWDYRRTCVEGPVFNAEDVQF